MPRELGHFIGGKRVAGTSERRSDVYDPNTGLVQATVSLADRGETKAAIANAVDAQQEWGGWNPQRRARVLRNFLRLAEAELEELSRMLSAEHGKTVADARGDIQRGLEVAEFCCGAPHLLKGDYSGSASSGIDVYSMRQPLGVVAAITPFNFPAMIPLWKISPALACGNAVILKPSERDPSVPLRLAELFCEAGLPAGVLNVINGDKQAVDCLLEHPQIAAVGFVGSSDVAQYIYSTATAQGKRAQCFGGAKNHLIVMPDADLDQVVDALVGSAYGSAGERCMAVSVAVPVGQEVAEALAAALKARVGELRIGTSFDEQADFGPLVSSAARERVLSYIESGVQDGADLLVDGRRFSLAGHEGGFFLGASLFDHVDPSMRIYREEVFGPVLGVVRAATYEDALRLPSEHEYGNGVAIFTRDGNTARDFASRVNVGMVGINVPIPVPLAHYTFGGWKRSGFGDLNQFGADSFAFYSKTKTVTSRWPSGAKEGSSFVMPVIT